MGSGRAAGSRSWSTTAPRRRPHSSPSRTRLRSRRSTRPTVKGSLRSRSTTSARTRSLSERRSIHLPARSPRSAESRSSSSGSTRPDRRASSPSTASTTAQPTGVSPDPADVALLLHTSGTTSRPKLVPLTHGGLCRSARNVAETLRLDPTDRCLNVMPLFHIHGLVAALLASLAGGAPVACSPGFHQLRFFEWLEELAPTWYTAVPTMHAAVVARAHEHEATIVRNRLRLIRSSSAPLPVPVARRARDNVRRAGDRGLRHD